MANFSIYQGNIFRKLREGQGDINREEYFYEAMKLQADRIAARCNLRVTLNPTRVAEAQDLWDHDLKALLNDGKLAATSPYPCEYKHAAFLCFWLRRRVVVESVSLIDSSKPFDKDFMDFKNEYIAFYLALHLVIYHAYFKPGAPVTRQDEMSSFRFPTDLAHEALVMLHHKNVSPHALYLFFKALVTNLPPPMQNGAPLKSV